MRELAVDRVVFLIDLVHIGIVGQQVSARRAVAHWAVDGGRAVIFVAALVLGAVGAHIESADLEVRVAAVDLVGRVDRVILAITRIRLIFAVVEIVGREIRIVFGRIAVTQARFQLGVVAPLEIAADQQTARADLAAEDRAEARLELLVVIIERAAADIAAVKLIAIAQHDVERARNRITGAAC